MQLKSSGDNQPFSSLQWRMAVPEKIQKQKKGKSRSSSNLHIYFPDILEAVKFDIKPCEHNIITKHCYDTIEQHMNLEILNKNLSGYNCFPTLLLKVVGPVISLKGIPADTTWG